mgnify:CR=1 FL=1
MGRFAKALLAVLLGNLAYFTVMSKLPRWAQHAPNRLDWGLLLDFCWCALLYLAIEILFPARIRKTGPDG